MSAPRLDPSLIRDFDLFRGTSDEDLAALLERATVRRIEEGAAVFDQGAPADVFFVLLHGRVKAVQTTADGHQLVVRHIGPGELFGITPVLRSPVFPATAVAATESLALAWPTADWEMLFSRLPGFAMAAVTTVGERLREANTRLLELSTEEVERRIAHALLRLVAQAGRKTDEGILIDFPITRQDIADMTGSTLHTVSRLLSAWEGRGLVRNARRRVVVVEPHRLRLIADGVASKGAD